MKAGRNDPCPCGSGRKYKHCHGALQAAALATEAAPAQAPDAARADEPGTLVALLAQGRLAEVERQAGALLQSEPDSGILWKILGVALGRQGRDALPALRRAVQLLPDDAEAHRNLGAALRDRGELQEALASLRRSLELQPRDLPVLIAAANALCSLGRARESVPLYEEALRIEPRSLEALNNLGNALQELGDSAGAVDCYRLALAVAPADAEIHGNLGNALRQLRRLEEAVAASQRAIALAPGLSTAHNNLGLALAALGRPEQALASFRQAAALNPRFIEALNNLANVLRELGRYRDALASYRQALELDPRRADSHCDLGSTLYELGEVEEAAASYQRALQLQPEHRGAHLGLAAVQRLQGRAADAEASCRAALAIDPQSAAALALLGDLHADRGQFGEAHELFKRALALDPDDPAVFCSIAAHRRMTSADGAWLEGAKALLARRLSVSHEIALRFAIGKYHDDLRQYDDAFSQYRQANELGRRCVADFDRRQLTARVDGIIGRCDAAALAASRPGACLSELPVFIIGMPRSGTSLAEQILASHPQAFGAGEVRFWDDAAETLSGLEGEAAARACERVARDYLQRVSAAAGAALRVVDKLPANFLHAGLIHSVFPRAKIIHMQRHPIDTCLSMYFQNFVAMRAYASDLDDLACYYREYLRLSAHWRSVLPPPTLLEVPYEALIAEQEYWTRRMLDFVGLGWDARCLNFHETERVVITASRWQVRQKINSGSAGRWRNYEKYVEPLRPLVSLVGSGAD